MGLQATIYRWDDPGAPQLTDKTQAEWFALLKACLVDGYGDKQGAGWSVAYEDLVTDRLVLKNSASEGSGGFAVFWLYKANNMAVKTAPLISEVSPEWEAVANASYRHVFKMNYATKWIIIATAAGLYITTSGEGSYYDDMSQGTYEFPCFFLGDIHSYYAGDANTFTLLTANNIADASSGTWSRALGYLGDNYTVGRLGEVDGNSKQVVIKASTPFRTSESAIVNGDKDIVLLGSVILQTKDYSVNQTTQKYTDSQGVNFNESTLQPAVRGQFPGLFQSSTIGFSDSKWPVIRTFDSVEYVLIPSPYNGGCCFWMSGGEWYV